MVLKFYNFLYRAKAAKVKTTQTIQKELDKNVDLISEPKLREKVKMNIKSKAIAKEKIRAQANNKKKKDAMELEE